MANVNSTPTTIEQYREAKSQYLKLKNLAKKELISRFNALASELLQVQRELLEDFGEKISLPTKSSVPKKKPKPPTTSSSTEAAAAPNPADKAKAASLARQLDKQKKKLEELKAIGKSSKAVEDRIYELEDEIRLLQ
jgi:hypothetical protein